MSSSVSRKNTGEGAGSSSAVAAPSGAPGALPAVEGLPSPAGERLLAESSNLNSIAMGIAEDLAAAIAATDNEGGGGGGGGGGAAEPEVKAEAPPSGGGDAAAAAPQAAKAKA